MKKFFALMLACVMLVSAFSFNASAALPDTVQPLWNNTVDVVLGHRRIGTTSHVNVDITIDEGSTIMDASIKLFKMGDSTELVKTWTDPEWTVNAVNTHNFYDTYSPVESGVVYQLVFTCSVWHNGVEDEIGLYKNVQY